METDKRKQAEQAVRDFLEAFGIDIGKRPGMEETPARVVAMYEEVWEGENYTNEELAREHGKLFDSPCSDMVVLKDIEAFSWCEHHLALIYDMKISVGYLPRKKVLGLSKIARIVDLCCRRLQLQERIGNDIADVLSRLVGPDVCVKVEASHSCMTARGIKKPSSKTVTFAKRGVFNENRECFLDFLEAAN